MSKYIKLNDENDLFTINLLLGCGGICMGGEFWHSKNNNDNRIKSLDSTNVRDVELIYDLHMDVVSSGQVK